MNDMQKPICLSELILNGELSASIFVKLHLFILGNAVNSLIVKISTVIDFNVSIE